MPDHARKQIRDYVAAGMLDLPTTGARVYVGRTRPLAAAHEPTWLIYMRSETSSRTVRGAPPKIERPCTLHLEGRVSTATPPDDLLDQMAAEAEAAIAAMINYATAQFFGGLAQNVQFQSTEIIAEADANGERIIGGIRLDYLVTYRTIEGAATAVA
jgi:hypothetical protein